MKEQRIYVSECCRTTTSKIPVMEQNIFDIDFHGTPCRIFYVKEVSVAEQILSCFKEKDCFFGLDLETTALPIYANDRTAPLDPLRSVPRLLQISDGKNIAVFDLLFLPKDLFVEFLQTKRFIAHNAIFEIKHLLRFFNCKNFNVGCTYLATKLLHHAIYVDDGGISAGLEDVVKSVLKLEISKNISHSHWGNPKLNFEQIEYAAIDALVVTKLAPKLSTGLNKYGLGKIYELYKAAQVPLCKMELNGMRINSELHRELIGKWKLEALQAKKELTALTDLDDITGHTIANYLDKHLPPNIRAIWPLTETGKLSTDANTFSEFSFVDIVKPFSKFQKATILCSSFGMKLQQKINPVDNRIHTNYKLCGTRTGRLSSSNPNLQQMPRTAEFRSIFIPEEGNTFVVADFNQIELRICAELSRDQEMLRAYKKGIDLHTLTAANTSHKTMDEITKEDRQKAKALNFGLVFGLGANGFQKYAKKQYGVELSHAESLNEVTAWHDLYEGYTEFQQNQADSCKYSMNVRTPLGKLRKLSEENYYGASSNTPVQGGASEVILRSLCYLESMDPFNLKFINTVHDEIIVECADNEEEVLWAKSTLETSMIAGFNSVFPKGITKNLVQVSHGKTWAEAK